MSGDSTKTGTVALLEQLREEVEKLPLPLNNPHTLAESALKLAILLTEFVGPLSELETSYLESRGDNYQFYLDTGIKPTPAKDRLEFASDTIKIRKQLDYWKGYVKSKENVIFRIENYVNVKIKLETKQL